MKPKIVHIIHEGSGGGGATLSLTYFHRYQKKFSPFVICGCQGNLAQRLKDQGLKVYALHLDRPIPCIFSIPHLVYILLKEKPSASIIHGQWGGFCAAVASWIAGISQVIYYTHMPSFYTDWDFIRTIRNRLAELVTCKIATTVVCPSAANRYQYLLRNLVDEKKVIHIPNGIDTEEVKPSEDKIKLRQELGLPTDTKVIVSVGRLSDQKRVDWLIEAWCEVEKTTPDVDLFIIGDGEEKQALENLSTKLNLKRCHFLGRQPNGYKYFQAADLAVMTTMFEAQPYSLLEALSCGCPTIGTAADGVLETLTPLSSDLVCPVASPAQLANKMKALFSGDINLPIAKEIHRFAAEHYHIDCIVERQLKVITLQ
ncbi:MAG: glycosyltransferase [Verrucomicrobiota bacterium]